MKFSPERLLHSHADFISVLSSIPKCTASVLQPCVALLTSHNFFLQAIGLSLRDLLAHVDEEIQRLDPSSHKEASLHQLATSLINIVCKQRKSTLNIELTSKTLRRNNVDTCHVLASHLGDGAGASIGVGGCENDTARQPKLHKPRQKVN